MDPDLAVEDFTISKDKLLLDIPRIHRFLSEESYWAQGRSLEIVQKAIDNSLCFGVYSKTKQAGFARVVTDYATFAWLCDVFILPEYRGQGLSKWLVHTIVNDPDLQSLRRFLLATKDAHQLYAEYGNFRPIHNPERWMERIK
jgi:GNAT superfamily N-acetyltransferase